MHCDPQRTLTPCILHTHCCHKHWTLTLILFYTFLLYTIVVFIVLIQLLLLNEINHYLFITARSNGVHLRGK